MINVDNIGHNPYMLIKRKGNAMNVNLSEKFKTYIAELVESGLYNNASEVIREALRLKMQQEQTYQAKLEALRTDIDKACKQLDKGEFSEWNVENFIDELDESKK